MNKDKECGNKRRYATKLEAEDGMYRAVKQTGTRLHRLQVYKCGHCQSFHFGHTTKTRR